VTKTRPTVLHLPISDYATQLAELAAIGDTATAYCGATRVPIRPPFPQGAAVCWRCLVLAGYFPDPDAQVPQ
jgi:hypothetical protein